MKFRIISRRKLGSVKEDFFSLFKKHDLSLVKKFEDNFTDFIGSKYIVFVPSARYGMKIILESLNLKDGDEVIVPAYTLGALIGIIKSLKLKVVPVDIDARTFNIRVDLIARKITSKTKAIIVTHMFGNPCEMDSILGIAKDKSIYVIEDCAHAVGSKFKNRKVGSFGVASFFSFDTTKTINTYGGGCIVTNNQDLYLAIQGNLKSQNLKRSMPYKKIIFTFLEDTLSSTIFFYPIDFLLSSSWGHRKVFQLYKSMQSLTSFKCAFTVYQASLGLKKLAELNKKIAKRKKMADFLKKGLRKDIVIQEINPDSSTNYYFYVVMGAINAAKVRLELLKHGIDCGIQSEVADDCADILGFQDCPDAKRLYQYGIQIPFYESLTKSNIVYILNLLNNLL